MSLKKLQVYKWVLFGFSVLIGCTGIIMIVLLALKHQHHVYEVVGYTFLAIVCLLTILNFAILIRIVKLITWWEKEYEIKFKGWVYLIFSVFIFYLFFLFSKKLNDLFKQIIVSEKHQNFSELEQ